jgi:hypothetical protein
MKYRKFGKLEFALVGTHNTKANANEDAKERRQGGYNARVTKSGKKYQTWREVV